MGGPATYHFDLDSALRPAHAPLEERWWPGIRDAALKASSARIYDPIKGVRAVVIHATAGSSSAGADHWSPLTCFRYAAVAYAGATACQSQSAFGR